MITAINPVNVVPPVTTAGTDNNVNTIGSNVNTGNNVNSPEGAEDLTAFENAQLLAQLGATTQSTDDASLLDGGLLNSSPQALNVLNGTDGATVTTTSTGNNANNLEVVEELLAYENAQQLTQTGTTITQGTVDDSGGLLDAVLLNLSPQALNALGTIGGTVDTTGSITFSGSIGVTLTVQQQQQLASIVAEFANAPFDQNTFAQMQAALTAAGIDPEQISLQEMLQGMLAVSAPLASVDSEVVTSELTSELLDT